MRLRVQHRTAYGFSAPVSGVIQLLRLTPHSCTSQSVLDWRIDVQCDARLREQRDGYGNIIHMLYVDELVGELVITASGTVITEDRAGVVQAIPGDLPSGVFLRSTKLTRADPAIEELAATAGNVASDPLAILHALNRHLNQGLTFHTGVTDAGTTAAQAFAKGAGVCQDFAHIFIAAARRLGIPARYVSGHLFRRDGQSRQSATHAWAEAFVPNLGWVAFDPANGICADDAYVRVAAGLDYSETAPISGRRRGGGMESIAISTRVTDAPGNGIARRGRAGQSQSQSQSQ